MTRGRIVSRARQLRLNLQAREGQPITVQEAADRIGIDRKVLTRIELGKIERIDAETLKKLCVFYGVGVGEILEYNPNDIRTPMSAAVLNPTG